MKRNLISFLLPACLLDLVMVWGRWQGPGRKALASAISLGLLLIGNLLIGRPRSATTVPQATEHL